MIIVKDIIFKKLTKISVRKGIIMENYCIETKKLTKCYKDFAALKQVEIRVRRGEIYGLIGDNGAGKTTFLKIAAGLLFPTEGEIKLFGKNSERALEKERSRIGVLIDDVGFYPQLTIEQNMEYFRIQKGIPGKESVREALEMTGLAAYRKKKCRELSLGMKQRLGLAIALLGVPEVLILDEPINGLDPSGIIEMRNLLLKLNQEKNITILLSSHILSELEHMATVYGFLKNGEFLEQVTAKELRNRCREYVEIQVSDAEQYAVLLEKSFGTGDYQVLPDGKVHIFRTDMPIEAYSKLAAANGLAVVSLLRHQQTLEDYYIHLKKGGRML